MEKFNKILKNILIFLIVYMAISYVFQSCQGKQTEVTLNSGNVLFSTTSNEYSRREVVTVEIDNGTKETITVPNECPGEPFKVERMENNNWVQKNSTPELKCENKDPIKIEPGKNVKIEYDNWNNALFSEMGRFKISFDTAVGGQSQGGVPPGVGGQPKTFTTNEFNVVKEGIIRQLAIGLFFRPIYNGLMFLTSIMPNHDLGLAIILLTILIRTILLVPSQKAMKSQRKMQEIQPRLNKIKEQYKGDQQKIAMETMTVWKEAKINPFGSCLPVLLQFPFLIALFYVIKSGLNPDNAYLLYTNYGFALKDISVNFLGILDLTKANTYVLPIIIGLLQFVQMKLTMGAKKPANGEKNEMAMASSMMIYMMPILSASFTAVLPSGVGIYWGISTIYGIVQQIIVNKGSGKITKNDEPTVKVIDTSAN